MAVGAGSASRLPVFLVAGQASEAFVNSDWRTIIPVADLPVGQGRMALVTERLARVGAYLHGAVAIEHFGQR